MIRRTTTLSRFALTSLALALALPAIAATVVVRDDFSDSDSGWPNQVADHPTDLGFAVYTDGGGYQMTPVQDGAFGFIAAPKQASGGDVRVASDLFLYAGIGAGAAGLACRFQDHQNFYGFIARGDAVLAIVKVKDGEATTLASARIDTVMAGTVDTRLTIECKGDQLKLSAADAGSISANDSDFTEGRAGLIVIGEKMAGTSGAFDNFELADLAR